MTNINQIPLLFPGETIDCIDLFGGPGGWDEGIRPLGLVPLGFEFNPHACATRRAAGHRTIQADIAKVNPFQFPARGLIGSPPCQGFSMAGAGKGREDSVHLLEALKTVRSYDDVVRVIAELAPTMKDPRTLLVLEPLRWALANRPDWIAFEQVPAVLPLWEACAEVLRALGYSVETGKLTSEMYGVPQTRVRAILVARSAEMTAEKGPARLPAPTHSRYYSRSPEKLDEGVLPWVSMAQALGWSELRVVISNYGSGGDPAKRGERTSGQPAAAVTSKAGRNAVQLATGTRPAATARHETAPALTLAFGNDAASHVWAPELLPVSGVVEHKRNGGVRLTIQEAAVLQTFPADYPWQGNKGQQFQQVGDAVPCLMARAVIASVVGLPFAPAPRGSVT